MTVIAPCQRCYGSLILCRLWVKFWHHTNIEHSKLFSIETQVKKWGEGYWDDDNIKRRQNFENNNYGTKRHSLQKASELNGRNTWSKRGMHN